MHFGRALEQPGNGQWIYLFHPRLAHASPSPELIKTGWLEGERLVDLSKHTYDLEPNVTFTPDGKWVVFRSNMHGATHTYAVEVAKPHYTSNATIAVVDEPIATEGGQPIVTGDGTPITT